MPGGEAQRVLMGLGSAIPFPCAKCPVEIRPKSPYWMDYEFGVGAKARWHKVCPGKQQDAGPSESEKLRG